MFCSTGHTLHELYEAAEREKLAVSRRRDPMAPRNSSVEKEFHTAKQRYVENFANWLSHKAFCQDCKPKAPSRAERRTIEPAQSGISGKLSRAS